MRKVLLLNKEQRCWLALFGILIISSAVSVGLFAVRTPPSPHGPYTSLVLNLALAWTPLLLAWLVNKFIYSPNALIRALASVCAFLWIIFFPNSLYILTDFQHIALRDTNTPIWYDVVMLLWFAWSGVFLGAASLCLMQNVVTCRLGQLRSWIFAVIAIILTAVGVYIGRFVQINSWDLIIRPFYTLGILREHISYPPYRAQAVAYSILFALFFLFVYTMIFIFGQLIKGQNPRE